MRKYQNTQKSRSAMHCTVLSCAVAASLAALAAPAAAETISAEPGARYLVTVGFAAKPKAGEAQHMQVVRDTLARELQKLPGVALTLDGDKAAGRGGALKQLKSFYVDGSIQRLSTSRVGGQRQINCEVHAFVATWPDRAIQMMTTEGAELDMNSTAAESAGQRDCLVATAGAVREAVEKFLMTVK